MNFSLNMVKIKEIPPCFCLPDSLKGKIAWAAFSAGAICGRITRDCEALGLAEDSELPKGLSDCLQSKDPQVKNLADAISHELGRRLALAFYTAKHVEQVKAYSQEDFQKFTACRHFLLGGGLASGDLGRAIAASANETLALAGCDVVLECAPAAQYMPLLGCASLCPAGNSLVFDFGQTYMKRGIAIVQDKDVEGLVIRSKQPSRYIGVKWGWFAPFMKNAARRMESHVKDYILNTYRENEAMGLSDHIVISFAGKAENNELLPLGAYGKIERFFPHFRQRLEAYISRQAGRAMHITLINDEQAAAYSAHGFDGLIVTLGTAFGLGEPAACAGQNIIDNVIIL